MKELKILKIKEFNEYLLAEEDRQYSFTLEFYNMPKPEEGDILIVPEEYLNTTSPDFVQSLYFEPLKDEEKVKKSDIAGLYTKNKNYILKRIYG